MFLSRWVRMHWTHEELHLCVSSLDSCPVVIEKLSGRRRPAESAAAAKEEVRGLTPGGLAAALPHFCILNIKQLCTLSSDERTKKVRNLLERWSHWCRINTPYRLFHLVNTVRQIWVTHDKMCLFVYGHFKWPLQQWAYLFVNFHSPLLVDVLMWYFKDVSHEYLIILKASKTTISFTRWASDHHSVCDGRSTADGCMLLH